MHCLGFDLGSNSVGSAWVAAGHDKIVTGTSIFPAGVDESDDKRGEPKNAKRRMTRRTRITLARRSQRKRELRTHLVEVGLLPPTAHAYRSLVDECDPWELRRKGLDEELSPHEFGRVLLHLAQRRGALGLKLGDPESEEGDAPDDGKVKAAIGDVQRKMAAQEPPARTFGEFIACVREERVTEIQTPDRRPRGKRKGPRQFRDSVRNKGGNYEHCADREMIRHEFAMLWDKQRSFNGTLARMLTDDLRLRLDNEEGDSLWRHKGLLFGHRRQSWDLGTLGRCVLEPTERCVPHADMEASRYRVVETLNNLKIIERGKPARPLMPDEREKIRTYLSGPLGEITSGKKKGQPKQSVTVTDLRNLMGTAKEGWGRSSKHSRFRFNIENDADRTINTDWFSREIIHGAVTPDAWEGMPTNVRDGLNRAILKFDPDHDGDAEKLKRGVMDWAKLDETRADALVEAWKRRPKPDAKRLNVSRRAVRNLLSLMDREQPWPDDTSPTGSRWITQIEARKLIAEDEDFRDVTTGEPLDDHARRRYATGAKGVTARDRYYMRKHVLMKDGKPVLDPEGRPLAEPPPAPLISNPVVRKAIHEVRRHLVEYMMTFERKPDRVVIELAREARMGKKDADRLLFKNRLRNRIRKDILNEFDLHALTSTQQRAAVDRVILAVQQGGVCPLCGNTVVKDAITPRMAALGEGCEVAHIIPRASGGHNGLSNIVLSHTKCNRDMGRQTPRQFWASRDGFEAGMAIVESIYGEIERPKPSEIKNATGNALWCCYSNRRDDARKIEQFKKDVTDIQEMTPRQEAATKYAARQIMAYLADALYDGKGLPERGGERRIFTTDGMWTSRFRREWGLFFDPHGMKSHDLSSDEEHERREKNRGDHRHHAIDAVVIALCDDSMKRAWDARERRAEVDGVNAADEEQMEAYRRSNPLNPPAPFRTRQEFREGVRLAVFGENGQARPICHRPVKRKLVGALHEETLFGPVLDQDGGLTGSYTARKSVLALSPNHLRVPDDWDALSRQLDDPSLPKSQERRIKAALRDLPDPSPGKSGIVRDRALRDRLRKCLRGNGVDPDSFSANDIKKLAESGRIIQRSGVPIRSVVLLRTMTDPVLTPRRKFDHESGKWVRDAGKEEGLPPEKHSRADRAYVGGNNHHIELRVTTKKNGKEAWTGVIVSAYEAAQRKLARLRARRDARIPAPDALKEMSRAERGTYSRQLRDLERIHPIVDRRDNEELGGRFIMSLCEGETLWMKHKRSDAVDYFVVAKLDKPNRVVLVPHWDARAATPRKDAEGKKVPDSVREQFTVTPSDLASLAPPGEIHARKVRASPLGRVVLLERD